MSICKPLKGFTKMCKVCDDLKGDFLRYYHALSSMLGQKYAGKRYVNALDLQEFQQLRAKIYKRNTIDCNEWYTWFADRFRHLGTLVITRYQCTFVLSLETLVNENLQNELRDQIEKAQTTFMCCIHKLMIKDMRIMLCQYLQKAQELLWFERNAMVKKFMFRNFDNMDIEDSD